MAGATPRLNAWKRLAIVATVLGVLGGTATLHVLTMNQQSEFAMNLETFCLHGYDRLEQQYPGVSDYTVQREKCVTDAVHNATLTPASIVLRDSFLFACGLVLAAWVLFGIVFATVRWILAGRAKPAITGEEQGIREIGESR